jgi:hypothetical protein
MECLTLWELCEGNLEWGLPCCGPLTICRKALETGNSSYRGPALGNLGEGSSTGDFEMDEGGSVDELPPSLFEEAPRRSLVRISFTGDARRYFRRSLDARPLFSGAPPLYGEPGMGGSYAGDFDG